MAGESVTFPGSSDPSYWQSILGSSAQAFLSAAAKNLEPDSQPSRAAVQAPEKDNSKLMLYGGIALGIVLLVVALRK